MSSKPNTSPKAAEEATSIDVTSIEAGASEPEANKLFRMVDEAQGVRSPPQGRPAACMRLAGRTPAMALPPLTTADMERLMFPILTPSRKGFSRKRAEPTSPTSFMMASWKPASASTCSAPEAG